MTSAADPALPPSTPPRGRWRTPIIVLGIIVLLGAGAGVAALFGGWDTVEISRDVVPEVVPGTDIDAAPFTVTIDDVWLSGVGPTGFSEPSEEGDVFLVVRARVTNRDDSSLSAVTFDEHLVRFARQDELDRYDQYATFRRADDLTGSVQLSSGVEVPLLVSWEIPGTWYQAGDVLPLQVHESATRRSSLDSVQMVWDDRGPIAKLEVPLTWREEGL